MADSSKGRRRPPGGAKRTTGKPSNKAPRRPGNAAQARGPKPLNPRPRRTADFDPNRRPAPPRRAESRRDGAPSWRNSSNWLDLALSLVQAPVGAAQSQAERLVGELVKTGQLGQREAERLLNEVRRARVLAQDRGRTEADRIDRFIEGRIEEVLNRVNIPSRSDIDRLNTSVEMLTRKVDALLSRAPASKEAP
jgi:poly(hydroxyalkanoate) granule-associated protein